jgi:hypothetical protein
VIDVYEMVGQYYVVDGHHRVALARRRGASYITAKVVQVRLPGMHPLLTGSPGQAASGTIPGEAPKRPTSTRSRPRPEVGARTA